MKTTQPDDLAQLRQERRNAAIRADLLLPEINRASDAVGQAYVAIMAVGMHNMRNDHTGDEEHFETTKTSLNLLKTLLLSQLATIDRVLAPHDYSQDEE